MQKIDDYIVSVLITLSIVVGGYLIAQAIHISGPLTMVAAGLIIGNYGKKTDCQKSVGRCKGNRLTVG